MIAICKNLPADSCAQRLSAEISDLQARRSRILMMAASQVRDHVVGRLTAEIANLEARRASIRRQGR